MEGRDWKLDREAKEGFNFVNELNRRIKNIDKALSKPRPIAPDVYDTSPRGHVVVKNVGENRQVVGFNLNERDSKILAASQRPKVMRDAEGTELQLVSFQPMLELEARKQGLLKV